MSKYKEFTEAYAKSVTEDVFVKQHAHLADKFNLKEVWAHFNPKQPKEPIK